MSTTQHPARPGVRRVSLITAGAVLVAGAVGAAALPTAAAPAHGGDRAAAACVKVARAYGDLGRGYTFGTAWFSGGTHRADEVVIGSGPVEPGQKVQVWCGFAGDDVISDSWGWVYGGPGDDGMGENWLVFRGGPGDDSVSPNEAFFDGGPGNDSVHPNSGTFLGGFGNDSVLLNEGTFRGGPGRDTVELNHGLFDGGPGFDVVRENHGTCLRVERGC